MVQYGPERVPSSIKVTSLTSVNTGTNHSISHKGLYSLMKQKDHIRCGLLANAKVVLSD